MWFHWETIEEIDIMSTKKKEKKRKADVFATTWQFRLSGLAPVLFPLNTTLYISSALCCHFCGPECITHVHVGLVFGIRAREVMRVY